VTFFASEFNIADRKVGETHPCLIIGEAGINHFGSLEKAFALVDLAVSAAADIVKFQHFRTDALVGEDALDWRDRLRSKELSDDDMLRIRDYCDKQKIVFMCTGHDEESLDFLDKVADVPAFKIGSGEVKNWPSLKGIACRGKPMVLSTGMYTMDDIEKALNAIEEGGCNKLAVLHCITAYPSPPEDINLAVMAQIQAIFPGPIGYSDHTTGTAVPLAAVAQGATIIEKHITIDRDVPNAQDWKVSCDPSNFANFVRDIREIEAALGGNKKLLSEREHQSIIWARKSLHAASNIPAGTVIAKNMLLAQRPGDGIAPSEINEVVGKTANADIASGTKIENSWLS
jgi:N,N'-diacetyllegionaminate synthase